MSKLQTAQRVSTELSDNFVFQRSRLAYEHASHMLWGDVLEIGTGSGYGVSTLAPSCRRFVTIDKNHVQRDFGIDNVECFCMEVPPLHFADESFDCVVSFQVIEHIENDLQLMREVRRVLRPGGKFIFSTPNAPMSLTRNPWHVREYTQEQLCQLTLSVFDGVECYGVTGNDAVMEYYRKNAQSVKKFTRFDILDLQHRLPRRMLQIPYDILNRVNRLLLLKNNRTLTGSIKMEDYSVLPLEECSHKAFDLFYVACKN